MIEKELLYGRWVRFCGDSGWAMRHRAVFLQHYTRLESHLQKYSGKMAPLEPLKKKPHFDPRRSFHAHQFF